MDHIQNTIKLMITKLSFIIGLVVVAILPIIFLKIHLVFDDISKGYVYQDKYEKLWLPYNFHVEMYENMLSRFALIKDTNGRKLIYYKNDYKTPHSRLFSNKNIYLSSNYAVVGVIDTLDDVGPQKIVVLASKFYSREFRQLVNRYAEFRYYVDLVEDSVMHKIISSLKNVN